MSKDPVGTKYILDGIGNTFTVKRLLPGQTLDSDDLKIVFTSDNEAEASAYRDHLTTGSHFEYFRKGSESYQFGGKDDSGHDYSTPPTE